MEKTAPHLFDYTLVCYTCMLMLYAGDVTLYLYANGM